jgi:serine/threonine protein kinase
VSERLIDLAGPPGGVLGGRYELEEVIGAGTTSNVFRARDLELEREVAVKVLHPRLAAYEDQVAAFRLEARTAAGLSHRNVVTVITQGESGGTPFTVFEYVEGMSVRQLLDRAGKLSVRRALELAIEIADGLGFAHTHGYVHRDVEPRNVLVDRQGVPKLADFGIDGPAGVGSSAYRAPELAQGAVATARSDVYSLGALLYELLTGEPPFVGAPWPSRLRPELAPRLDRAIARALAPKPSDRFPTMAAFAAELRACLQELQPGRAAAGVAPAPAEPATSSRRRFVLPLAVVGVLALAALGAFYLLRGSPDHAPKRAVVPKPHPKKSTPPAHPAAPPAPLPHLREVAAYDPPPGDGVEMNGELPYATDGNPSTAWSTEWYGTPQFAGIKTGVGIVVDAGKPVRLPALTVQSDTPGFTAVVKMGPSPSGPFHAISGQKTVGARTRFVLHGGRGRYYLLWVTSLSPSTGPKYHADVNEITATRAPAKP